MRQLSVLDIEVSRNAAASIHSRKSRWMKAAVFCVEISCRETIDSRHFLRKHPALPQVFARTCTTITRIIDLGKGRERGNEKNNVVVGYQPALEHCNTDLAG